MERTRKVLGMPGIKTDGGWAIDAPYFLLLGNPKHN